MSTIHCEFAMRTVPLSGLQSMVAALFFPTNLFITLSLYGLEVKVTNLQTISHGTTLYQKDKVSPIDHPKGDATLTLKHGALTPVHFTVT